MIEIMVEDNFRNQSMKKTMLAEEGHLRDKIGQKTQSMIMKTTKVEK